MRFGRTNERSASSSYFKQANDEEVLPVQFNIFSKTLLKKNEFIYFFRVVNDWNREEQKITLIKYNLVEQKMFDYLDETVKLADVETMESSIDKVETV